MQPDPMPLTRRAARESERQLQTTGLRGTSEAGASLPEVFVSRRARREAERAHTAPAERAQTYPKVPAAASDVAVETPASFGRNERAAQEAGAADKQPSKREKPNSRRNARSLLVRSGIGVAALGVAGSLAAFTTLPAATMAVRQDLAVGSESAALANAVSSLPSQTLTVTDGEATPSDRGSAYAVTTMGSATVANLSGGLTDRGTFSNDLTATVQWPFPVGVPITDGFGPRVSPGGIGSTNHMGLDLAPAQGTPIGAIAGGTVVSVTPVDNGGFGVNVVLEHVINGQTYQSRYAHMLQGSVTLQLGDVVKVGDQVGLIGNTGVSTGPHLHLELQDASGQKIDAQEFLKQNNVPSTVVTIQGE